MALDFHLKRNDLAPSLRGTISDGNGSPIDLSDIASVVFNMIDQDPSITVNKILRAPCTIENIVGGVVRYDWVAGDTDTASIYKGEFELTKSTGQPETIPNDGYLAIEIKPDLG